MDENADSPVFQACAERKSCVLQTSPSVSLLVMWFDAAIRVYIDVIDVYRMPQAAEFAKLQNDLRQRDPMFYQKLADARRQRQTTHA
jgi:hypothetical protein